jgi:hypothetical protein
LVSPRMCVLLGSIGNSCAVRPHGRFPPVEHDLASQFHEKPRRLRSREKNTRCDNGFLGGLPSIHKSCRSANRLRAASVHVPPVVTARFYRCILAEPLEEFRPAIPKPEPPHSSLGKRRLLFAAHFLRIFDVTKFANSCRRFFIQPSRVVAFTIYSLPSSGIIPALPTS